MMGNEELKRRFMYHPPVDEKRAQLHETIRGWFLSLANNIDSAVPDGREKTLSITNLEQAMFWANGGVARQ